MQAFVGLKGPPEQVRWRLVESERPQNFVEFTALDIVDETRIDGPSSVTYPDAWTGASLRLDVLPEGLGKIIEQDPGASRSYRFAVDPSPSLDLVVEDNAAHFDSGGERVFTGRRVWALDANEELVDATLENDAGTLVLIVADTTGRPGPITIDPTTTIADADIEDNQLRKNNVSNYSTLTLIQAGVSTSTSTIYRPIYWIQDSSLIPDGTIDVFRLDIWRWASSTSANAGTLWSDRISDANAFTFFNQTDWYEYKHGTAWVGSPGCGTQGTDFDATGRQSFAYSPYTSGPDVELQIPWNPTWAENFRDGVVSQLGVVQRVADETQTSNQLRFRSTEYATASNRPSIYIEYTEGGAGLPPFFLKKRG
jgi:hypothetical protein